MNINMKELTPNEIIERKRKRKQWENLEKEHSLFDQKLWLLISSLNQEYQTSLSVISKNMYNLHRLYQTRYIEYAKKHIPNLKKATENCLLPNIMKYLETHYYEYNIQSFDTFSRNEERRLWRMLDCIIGQKNRKLLLKANYKFNTLDYKFYSFLLDNFNSPAAKKLRMHKINEISNTLYFRLVRIGSYNLIQNSILKDKPDQKS